MSPRKSLQVFPLKTSRDLVQISFFGIPARPGATRALFDLLERHALAVKFLLEGGSGKDKRDLVVCITREGFTLLDQDLEEIKMRLQPQNMEIRRPVALVRVLGPHFDIQPGPSGLLFSALARAGIQVYSNATTITSSTCVIPEDQLETALRAIGKVFELPGAKRERSQEGC